ncbi:MAG: hypothetical protein GTO02_20365 [Candidatus Dadabacteria bacterium]|nr:hypothetical protein [Candidatus Dadabacteria bacterium]NIQ16651.1 hypothetical protein [Candidatus Dadabacteria bacterium]
MSNKHLKYIVTICLIIIFAILIHLFWQDLPLASKTTFNSNSHDHQYKPVFDKEGEIEYWTCEMHPSVRLEKPDSCPICNMDTIPVWKNKNENRKNITYGENKDE